MTLEASAPAPAPAAAPEAAAEAPLADTAAEDVPTGISGKIKSALAKRAGREAAEAPPAIETAEEPAAEAGTEETPAVEDPPPAAANADESALDAAKLEANRFRTQARDSERKFREMEQKLKELETGREADRKRWAEDPYGAAEEAGGSLRGWADRATETEAKTPEQVQIAALEARLAKREESDATAERTRVEQEQATEAQAAVDKEIGIVSDAVKADEGAFGLIGALGQEALVRERWYQAKTDTGEDPDLDSVLRGVEDEMADSLRQLVRSEAGRRVLRADDELMKFLTEGTKAVSDQEPAQQASTRADGSGDGPRTLTQKTTTQAARREKGKSPSDDERRSRALGVVQRIRDRVSTG